MKVESHYFCGKMTLESLLQLLLRLYTKVGGTVHSIYVATSTRKKGDGWFLAVKGSIILDSFSLFLSFFMAHLINVLHRYCLPAYSFIQSFNRVSVTLSQNFA